MRIAAYLGLNPRRPERLLVLAAATVLGALLFVSLAILAAIGEFAVLSPRAFYVVWIVALGAFALVCAPRPRLAALLLTVAAVDLGLGMGSFAAQGLGIQSILPPSYFPASGFRWHPLQQAVPRPSLDGGYAGRKIRHSAEGTRGRDWTAEELRTRTVVALFGGSTTYDIGVGDGETWADRLEQLLGANAYAVINHGSLGHTTVNHLISTAFYQGKFGRPPTCAVYYVGWNDIRNAHAPNLDAAFADYHLPYLVDSVQTRRVGGDFVTPSPLLTLLIRGLALAVDTVRPAPDLPLGSHATPDPRLEAIVARNVEAISAINRSRGIRTLWVGQIMNLQGLAASERSRWTPLILNKDTWPILLSLNRRVRETAERAGDVYLDVPADAFVAADWLGIGHFSSSGAAKFAGFLVEPVRASCR